MRRHRPGPIQPWAEARARGSCPAPLCGVKANTSKLVCKVSGWAPSPCGDVGTPRRGRTRPVSPPGVIQFPGNGNGALRALTTGLWRGHPPAATAHLGGGWNAWGGGAVREEEQHGGGFGAWLPRRTHCFVRPEGSLWASGEGAMHLDSKGSTRTSGVDTEPGGSPVFCPPHDAASGCWVRGRELQDSPLALPSLRGGHGADTNTHQERTAEGVEGCFTGTRLSTTLGTLLPAPSPPCSPAPPLCASAAHTAPITQPVAPSSPSHSQGGRVLRSFEGRMGSSRPHLRSGPRDERRARSSPEGPWTVSASLRQVF